MPTLADVTALLDAWYPPHTAEDWDAVGLVWGDPDQQVRRVLCAVDPAPAVAQEAAEASADLLLVHHPLFLKAVHGVPATTAKGRTLATLAGAGCALMTAHTNADQALDGVSESLALAVGLSDLTPIRPADGDPLDRLTVYVPTDAAAVVRAALAEAGAGTIGHYDFASFSSVGEGRFRPLEGAEPTIGIVGRIETVNEVRVEVILPRGRRSEVVRAMRQAHPYEEVAYDVVEVADALDGPAGSGRLGVLEAPTTLGEFAAAVEQALPTTAHGVRVAGDPDRPVRRVAVCGGSGDFLLDDVRRAGADVYLTSDLRHHPAVEALERGGPALVDVAHWAGEWTWLPRVAAKLAEALPGLDTRVSQLVTDPWTMRA